MADECKLCALLGAIPLSHGALSHILEAGNAKTHEEFHALQLDLINCVDYGITKTWTGTKGSNAGSKNPKAKSKKSTLLKFCRGLVKIHGNNSGMKCSQCNNSIRPQRDASDMAAKMISHACIHLNKDLFACRHCDFKFVTRTGVGSHLQSIHALSGIAANYINLTEDHQSDMRDMVKLCFGKAPKKQLHVTAIGKQKRNYQRSTYSLTFIREFVKAHCKNESFECSQCNQSIRFNGNASNIATRMINHACIHLNKDLFACTHCDLKFITKNGIRTHLQRSDNLCKNYIDMTGDHQGDILDMVKLCFAKAPNRQMHVTAIGKQKKNDGRRSKKFALFCRELVHHHGNKDMNCSQCNQLIRAQRDASGTAACMINHACVHLNKNLFACRHCDLKFVTSSGIRTHLQRNHMLGCTSKNYIDTTEDHQIDIMDMVNLCFGEASQKKLDVTAIGKQKRNTNQSYKTPLSKLAHSIVAKYEPGDGIQCHLCPRSIKYGCLSIASKKLIDHAHWHLDEPMFTCRLCQYSASNEATIRNHLITKHSANSFQQNFHDGSTEVSEKIISMLEDCFGEMREKPGFFSQDQERAPSKANRFRRNILAAELIKKHAKDGKLICRICFKDSKTTQKNGSVASSTLILNHSVTHLDRQFWPYLCKFCSHVSNHRSNMRVHLRQRHKGKSSNEFENTEDRFHVEIMACVSKCYDWSIEAGMS